MQSSLNTELGLFAFIAIHRKNIHNRKVAQP